MEEEFDDDEIDDKLGGATSFCVLVVRCLGLLASLYGFCVFAGFGKSLPVLTCLTT